MPSSFAQRFNAQARPLLWKQHGEPVKYYRGTGRARTLTVIWKQGDPHATDQDGLGLDTFHATATAVVRVADLSKPDGKAELERLGERWAIRRIARQDAWTWIFHLRRPDPELALPQGLRG